MLAEAIAVSTFQEWRLPPRMGSIRRRRREDVDLSGPEAAGRRDDGAGLTDAVLVYRVVRHDRAAYAELFRRYAPKIKSFHLGLRATPAQADDLLQDVMVTIWRRAETYDSTKANVSTWIYTIARNRFIDRVRKEKRSEILMEYEDDRPSEELRLDDAMSLNQQTTALRAALTALPPEQHTVISMAFLKEMSHGEIAAALDLPLGTVKSRIRLAMVRLKDQLESVR